MIIQWIKKLLGIKALEQQIAALEDYILEKELK